MPLVMAGGDVSKSNLSFGNTAEYLAKFSSSKEKPYNLSSVSYTHLLKASSFWTVGQVPELILCSRK